MTPRMTTPRNDEQEDEDHHQQPRQQRNRDQQHRRIRLPFHTMSVVTTNVTRMAELLQQQQQQQQEENPRYPYSRSLPPIQRTTLAELGGRLIPCSSIESTRVDDSGQMTMITPTFFSSSTSTSSRTFTDVDREELLRTIDAALAIVG